MANDAATNGARGGGEGSEVTIDGDPDRQLQIRNEKRGEAKN